MFGVVSLDLGVIPIVLVVGFVVMLFVIVGLISSTLNSIYTAAVYQYATTGKSGEFFESQLVENAFRRK